jgi:channel protein (hemolysin III family)
VEGSITALLGFDDPIASWLHLVGAVVAVVAARALIASGASRAERGALAVFGSSVVLALALSGAYHAAAEHGALRQVLQRLDHAAIWVLIAGTFTPIHAICFRGFARWGMLAIIWTAAVTGVVLKTVFFADFPEALGLFLYLALGWVGAISAVMLARAYSWRAGRPLLAGGAIYTLGGAVSILEHPTLWPGYVGHHELFHLAVLAALLLHWRFIAALRAPAPAPVPVQSLA